MLEFVALLRGVNVGGVKVPMADLRDTAAGCGLDDVRSYIASGNLVFRASGSVAEVRARLEAAIARRFGRDIPVWTATGPEFRAIVAACPYRVDDGRRVHALFPLGSAAVDPEAWSRWAKPSEALARAGGIFWLHTPEGFGQSAVGAKLDRIVTGDGVTGRNLNTTAALVEMLDG